jgi:glycosyltransferase involved in cell wall biosynthesis
LNRFVHICNFLLEAVFDGGTNRRQALEAFVASRGGTRLEVRDPRQWRSRAGRLMRVASLIAQVRAARPRVVLLSYPSYPFYWRHRVTPYLCMSLLFAAALRRESRRSGFKIVIDITDLPVFQYRDLGFEIGMSPRTMRCFDRFILSRADMLWVCSSGLVELIAETYSIERKNMVFAPNGHDMGGVPAAVDAGVFRFAYAGSLNRARGIGVMLDAFLASRTDDAEIHLCGPYGEWIGNEYDDRRIVHHGALTDAQAREELAGCDIGVIPYPESGYYNLAFPTKLAFYLSLGMPVLCTKAVEAAEYVERTGIGMSHRVDDLSAAFEFLASRPAQVSAWRRRVLEVRPDLSWTSIYSGALAATFPDRLE